MLMYLSMIETDADKNKFVKLYDNYRFTMSHVAMKILKNQNQAEDAVHDSFVKKIKSLDKINDIFCQETKSLLVIVVKNCAIDILRKERGIQRSDLDIEEYRLEAKLPTPIEQIVNKEGYEILLGCIKKLDDILKTAFELKYLHEYSVKEIASLLQTSENNVSQRISRARKQLLNNLEKEGIRLE